MNVAMLSPNNFVHMRAPRNGPELSGSQSPGRSPFWDFTGWLYGREPGTGWAPTSAGVFNRRCGMATTKRKDFDAELAAWLDDVHASQAGAELYADLWLANVEAKAIKDPQSPAAEAKHEEVNRLIGRIEAL